MSTDETKDEASFCHPWTWFRRKLVTGEWSSDDLRPLDSRLSAPLLDVLQQLRIHGGTGLDDTIVLQRTLPGKGTISLLFRMAPEQPLFCATVSRDQGRYRLQQVEAITLDLGELPALPCDARFLVPPSDETASWIRGEIAMTERVRLFNYLSARLPRESALALFRDGAGYVLAARSWIPYMEPPLAFLWYAAWSETHLHGNPVVLRNAAPGGGCLVMVNPLHRRLYRQAVHLKMQISEEDYEAIFETIWRDRAENAGFRLEIKEQAGLELVFLAGRDQSPS